VTGRRGMVRLLNAADGRVLCLAGEVDTGAVEDFWRWYGREPARIDVIDLRSVTVLSPSGRRLVADHLDAAERAGRPVELRGAGGASSGWPGPFPAPPRR
jgi:hypothetical protein